MAAAAAARAAGGPVLWAWICRACVKRTKSHSASRMTPMVSTLCSAMRSLLRPGSEPAKRSTHRSHARTRTPAGTPAARDGEAAGVMACR